MRIFFATDVHGSETCWRKFLRCGEFYGADVIVLGGDMTGKALVPIVENPDGTYHTYLQEQRHDFEGEEELARYEKMIRERGLYPFRTTEDDLADLAADPEELDRLFNEEMLKTVDQWVALADERLTHSDVRCFVCPGNDDCLEVDDVLAKSKRLELAEGKVLDVGGGFELLSTGWSNRTPWQTHREEDETDLAKRIEAMLAETQSAPERLIFNFHCPPRDTSLDEAPKLDDEMAIVAHTTAHVGSTAVREAIESVEPLLSLHGHIHESRGAVRLGRTLAVNPGSSYEQGVLLGAIVELDGKSKVKRYQLTTG